MSDSLSLHRSWSLARLSQECAHAFIEQYGVATFERRYTQLNRQIQRYSADPDQQIVYASIQLIDAARWDSPKQDTDRCALTLIWLGRHHQSAASLPLSRLIDEMMPAYALEYGGQSALSRAFRHRGYLVYQTEGTCQQVHITCVLYHPDERTQIMVHGRDDSRCILSKQRETVDRYVFPIWPGERLQFTLFREQEKTCQHVWYTMTPFGPLEEASRSTIWLTILHHSETATTW